VCLQEAYFFQGGRDDWGPLDYWFTVVFCGEGMGRSTSIAQGNLGASENHVLRGLATYISL